MPLLHASLRLRSLPMRRTSAFDEQQAANEWLAYRLDPAFNAAAGDEEPGVALPAAETGRSVSSEKTEAQWEARRARAFQGGGSRMNESQSLESVRPLLPAIVYSAQRAAHGGVTLCEQTASRGPALCTLIG